MNDLDIPITETPAHDGSFLGQSLTTLRTPPLKPSKKFSLSFSRSAVIREPLALWRSQVRYPASLNHGPSYISKMAILYGLIDRFSNTLTNRHFV